MTNSKIKSTILVKVVYLVALAAGYGTSLLFPDLDLLSRSAIADFVATVVVFLFSHFTGNASLYDPYWSVIPMALAGWWLIELGSAEMNIYDWIMVGTVFYWGIRLTMNWWTGWTGMDHQDWRYTDLKKKHGKLYPLVNFGGIHLLPTVLVFLGCIPVYFIIQAQGIYEVSPIYAILCILITFGAISIEGIADYQRRTKYNHDGGEVYQSGVWSWSRHPNYFGEIMFWVGLFMYVMGFGTEMLWTGIGALAMILLFVFISIPMMEERQVANKPSYVDYQKRVSSLIPMPPKAVGSQEK